MIFKWFKIFNLTAFEATDLVSRTYTQILEGIGQKDILVTKGELVSMLYEGIFLPLELNEINPFIKLAETDAETDLAYAIYIDANNDVFLGIKEPS